jgi:TetR/AcrR family transcriptional regulator, multidrug resistance operon repressor
LWQVEMDKMIEATLRDFDPGMSFADGLRHQWINRVKHCLENPTSMHFMEQIKYSPFYPIALKHMNPRFVNEMGTFVHNAIKRKELVKLPIEIYWSIAFAPMYQLVKFHMSGRGLGGRVEKFVLDEKAISLSLELVLKALTPSTKK